MLQNNILFETLSAPFHGQLACFAGVILMLDVGAFDVAVVLTGVSLVK